MKLLIAPWGNPFSWNEVEYHFEGLTCRSKTSLPLLIQKLKPDRILILVADSLADTKGNTRIENYTDIKHIVEQKIKRFLKENSIPEAEICVLPGTGYFPNGSFEGQVLDYYYCLLHKLAELFVLEEISEVHLDLTHGLNFMPVLTYRAIKEIVQVSNYFGSIQFTAYNADPFVKRDAVIKLNLHVVENTEEKPLLPLLSPYEVNESSKFFEKLVLDNTGKKLESVEKPWLKDVLTFLGGLVYGLPLVLTSFFVPSHEISSCLRRAIKVFEDKMEIFLTDQCIHLRRKARLMPLFRVLVLVYMVSSLFEKDGILNHRYEEIGLSLFKNIVDKLFGKHTIFKSTLNIEIKNIERLSNITTDWQLWNQIIERPVGNIDQRNFFAHGGLERNAIELCRKNEDIRLRYLPSVKGNVQKFVLKVLK